MPLISTDSHGFRLSLANLRTRNYFFFTECWVAASFFFACRRLDLLEVWPRCRQPVSRWEGTILFWMKTCCSPCGSFQTPTTMACMPNSSTTTAPISWHLALWEVSLSTSLSLTRKKWEEKVRKLQNIICYQLSSLNQKFPTWRPWRGPVHQGNSPASGCSP